MLLFIWFLILAWLTYIPVEKMLSLLELLFTGEEVVFGGTNVPLEKK